MKLNPQLTYNLQLITWVVVVSLLLGIGYQLSVARAQVPAQVILTWQANNFYPADYIGKALATPNTPLTVSTEVLYNNKLIDLSEGVFTWYVDEKFLTRTQGLKEILFTVKNPAGDSHFVRVTIQLRDNLFESSIRIPISKQTVIIESSSSNQLVKAGSRVLLQAIPYFFNVSSFQNLLFFWQVGEEEHEAGGDNQLILNISASQTLNQDTLPIVILVQNKNNLLEFTNERIKLTIY